MLEIIFYVMGALLGISLVAKLMSTITVRKMVKEAAEIQKSNHKLMKLIKAKFEHASLVSDRVQNVGAFVDKYIYEYKVFGIRLNTWRGIPKKALLLILILGVFSVCESIRTNGFAETTVSYIQWTSIFILLLALVQFVSGENMRLQGARNYMVEYLENVCIHRYAKRHNMTSEEQSAEENLPETSVEAMQANNQMVEAAKETAKETTEEVAKNTLKSAAAEAVPDLKDTLKEVAQEVVQEEVTEPVKLQIAPQMSEEEERSQQEMRIRAILEEFLA